MWTIISENNFQTGSIDQKAQFPSLCLEQEQFTVAIQLPCSIKQHEQFKHFDKLLKV